MEKNALDDEENASTRKKRPTKLNGTTNMSINTSGIQCITNNISAVKDSLNHTAVEAGGVAPTTEPEHYILDGPQVTRVGRTETK